MEISTIERQEHDEIEPKRVNRIDFSIGLFVLGGLAVLGLFVGRFLLH